MDYAYHFKGWYFKRLDGGAVELTKRGSEYKNSSIVAQIVIDADTWASIVAGVSNRGESHETCREASYFHQRS